MPALSPTMTQGNLGEWKKKVGEEIQPGDVLVEIETDKAQMDFECQEEGFLAKILVETGTKDVPVSTLLCVLAENQDDIGKFENFVAESTKESTKLEPVASKKEPKAPLQDASTPKTPNESSDRIFVSPIAKQLALEKGIKLELVKGTGPEGRIAKQLIILAPASIPNLQTVASTTPTGYKDIPLSNVRKVIADRLSKSKTTTPHYYVTQEIEMDRVLKLREVLNGQANGKFKLSVNDFVIKASSLALKDVPALNSAWNGDFIREYEHADIAVAVATDTGLITPIITKVESKGLAAISNGVKRLAERGRAGKLTPQEYQGGTFTISNLGMYGISHFTAIINPPHAAILAVGGIQDKLTLDEASEKGFKSIKVMNVTLNPDHRIVDGAVAAQWIQKFKAYIENPLTMLL